MARPSFLIALQLIAFGMGYARADTLDDQIREAMKKNNVPGAVIMVLRDGKIVKQEAYGLANVELQVQSKVTDVYPLASATKVFTATAVLLLVQDGKLRLDEPIGKTLPVLPEKWRELTIQQCLNHATGLPDIFEDDSPVPIAWEQDELIKKLQSLPLAYEPGTRSVYEQTDYVLLRMVVEQIIGKTLPDFVTQRILVPLGMTSTRYGDYRDVIPGRVSFYWRYPPAADRMHIVRPNGQAVPSADTIWSNPFFYATYDLGGVGLNMNAGDLAKFDSALWTGRLLHKGLFEEMIKPVILPNGKRAPFALGWQINSVKGDRIVYHDGAGAIIYAHDLDTNTTLIVLTNCNGGRPYGIMQQLLRKFSPSGDLT
jgi:D-alanyl-D-alanine carboxypeptidase